MADVAESAAKVAKRRLAELKDARTSYEDHWRQLAEFFSPRRSRWLDKDSGSNRGNKMNQKLVDPTPRFCARTLGAGMHAGSTNPATPWFRLTTPDPEMMEFPSVANWLYAVENIIRDIFERSNLYSVLPGIYSDGGVFGTAPMLMPEHRERVIHFVPKPIGSYYLATDPDGTIDTMYCEYQNTVRNLAQEFGKDNLSDSSKEAFRSDRKQLLVDVLHAVEPNVGRKAGAFDNRNMRYASNYFELKAGDEQAPLRQSGFEDNALATFRWETTELTDPYGSSCGMDALGLSKSLQVQTKQKAKVIDKHVDPPMVGDSALQNQPSSLLPGDITYAGFTQTGSAPKFQPAITVDPKASTVVLEDIRDTRQIIEEAMYTRLFFAITRADPRNATVPEIDARREEQILALGPVLQNQTSMMKQVIDRTFNIGMRQGRFPPPPQELSGVSLKVEMIGALSQAFKAIAGGKIERFAAYVGTIAKYQADSGQEVTAFDKFDALQSIDEYGQAIGIPPSIIRGDDDVEQIQQARAQAQQQQQMAAAAGPVKDAAMAAKALSETQMGTGSALDAVAA
jgi:hypothetical protein